MKIAVIKIFTLVLLIAVMVMTLQCLPNTSTSTDVSPLKKFSSYEELNDFVKASQTTQRNWSWGWAEDALTFFSKGGTEADSNSGAPDYSGTNIQVAGVDEADIIKTDGEYIYIVSQNKVIIVKAYPAEEAQVLSEIEMDSYISGIFVNGDKLAILAGEQVYFYEDVIREGDVTPYVYEPSSNVKVYDISDRSNPLITRNVTFSGHYLNSRMIEDYVYVIITNPVYQVNEEIKALRG